MPSKFRVIASADITAGDEIAFVSSKGHDDADGIQYAAPITPVHVAVGIKSDGVALTSAKRGFEVKIVLHATNGGRD